MLFLLLKIALVAGTSYYTVGLVVGLWLVYRMKFGCDTVADRRHTIFVIGGLAWLFIAAIWVWAKIEGPNPTVYVAARGSESPPNHKLRPH